MKKLFIALFTVLLLTSSAAFANINEPFVSVSFNSDEEMLKGSFKNPLLPNLGNMSLGFSHTNKKENGVDTSETDFYIGQSIKVPVLGSIHIATGLSKYGKADLKTNNKIAISKGWYYPLTDKILVGGSLSVLTIHMKSDTKFELLHKFAGKVAFQIKLLDI